MDLSQFAFYVNMWYNVSILNPVGYVLKEVYTMEKKFERFVTKTHAIRLTEFNHYFVPLEQEKNLREAIKKVVVSLDMTGTWQELGKPQVVEIKLDSPWESDKMRLQGYIVILNRPETPTPRPTMWATAAPNWM